MFAKNCETKTESCEACEWKSKDFGGALYLLDIDHSTFVHCYYKNNTSQEGGCLYIYGYDKTSITVHSSNFAGNMADNIGGCLYIVNVHKLVLIKVKII